MLASSLADSLEGLVKHRTLRKPPLTRLSTTLVPMKPDAPVTRIGSSCPTIICSRFIWKLLSAHCQSSDFRLLGHIALLNGIDANGRKYFAQMVKKLDQILHEYVLPRQEQKRKCDHVCRNSDHRLHNLAGPKSRVDNRHFSAKQGPFNHEAALPSCRGHDLIGDCLVAPNENVAFLDHSSEKILILASEKFRSES